MAATDLAAADAAAMTTLPRCRCGKLAIAFFAGTEPWRDAAVRRIRAPRDMLMDAGEPARAYCARCLGWAGWPE